MALDPDPDAAQRDLDILADQIPRVASIYAPSGSRASTTYALMLGQEPSAFVLQRDRQSALEATRAMYDARRPGRLTPEYQAYQDLLQRKVEAEDALATAQVEEAASGTPVPAGLAAEVQRLARLLEEPAKRFQPLERALDRANDEHMAARFYRANQKLEGASADGAPSVVATPPPEAWSSQEGWIPWRFSAKDLPVSPPFPSKGPSPSGRSTEVPGTFLATLTIGMDIRRVTFARPWMDLGLFTSGFWRMRPSAPFPLLSSGQPDSPSPGPMPWRIDGLLLARNLQIHGAWEDPADPRLLATAGLLPFTPRGPGTLVPSPGPAEGSLVLRAPGIQIIGLFCTLLPRCPDPDPRAFRIPEAVH